MTVASRALQHSCFIVGLFVSTLSAVAPALADAAQSDYAKGKVVKGITKAECDSPVLLDGIMKLCKLFGGGCKNPSPECWTYAREVFTGTQIKPGTTGFGNGMGGSGELVADSLLCTMRELSPELHGPLVVGTSPIDLGIGDLVATQEIGFVEWRRINPMFRGYRKIVLKLPVVGKADAVAQGFALTRRTYAHSGTKPSAGGREIANSFALIVDTESRKKAIEISPKGFPVTTPLGVFTVSPFFSYKTRAQIVDGGFNTTDVDVPKFFGGAHTVRYTDIFGLNAGLAQTTKPLGTYTTPAGSLTGWVSHIALGSRAPLTGASIWAPAGALHDRPDLNFSKPRSSVEAEPSVHVKAQGKVRYPDNPADFLPDWVFEIPFLTKNSLQAFVEVAPTIEAGVAGQLYLGAAEGRDQKFPQEFQYHLSRFSNSAVVSGLSVAGSFRIEVRLVLKVEADFPWPVNEVTFIDIDKTIPIPVTGDKKEKKPNAVGAWSTGFETPETLDHLRTLYADHPGAAAGAAIKQCYAPQNQPKPQAAPETPPEPGNPKDFFAKELWPCDVCVFTKAVKHDGSKDPAWDYKVVDLPAHGQYMMPSTGTPNWKCNAPSKSGCMNMCRRKPDNSLVIERTAGQIASGLPHGSADRLFYEACYYETAIAKPRGN